MNPIRVRGIGEVSFEELEAMLSAYINAGAPKPELEGTSEQVAATLQRVAARGDSQMKALVNIYLQE